MKKNNSKISFSDLRTCQMAHEEQMILLHFLSHEIKGFLSHSRNAFSMLLDGDYGEINPEVRALAEQGLDSGTKAVSFVQNILNAANIEGGGVQYVMEKLDLSSLVKRKYKDYQKIFEAKNIEFVLDIAPGDFHVSADMVHLKHVLKNLIENALGYTLKGSIKMSLYRSRNKVVFAIKDTGIGISPEDKKRLFTKGGRGTKSHKFNLSTTGYGLFIVKGIVEAHEGRVWAESEGVGKGSTFFVELPALN